MMGVLRRWFLHNFWLKVLSLLIATGLWLAISPDQEPAEVTMRVPIEFRNVPPELEPTDIHADLERKDAKPGEHTFDLTAQQIHVQRDLTVVQVAPVRVTVI